MAYTKIIPIRTRLDKAVNYALNKEKTGLDSAIEYISNPSKNTNDDTVYETAINCMLDTAYKDMIHTKNVYNQKDGVLGYHIIQSFMPNEVTAEDAHNIGVEFATRCFGDKYEIVISTHLDRHHYHNHIIINSVSFMDGIKFENTFKDYFRDIRMTSDAVCSEYNLSVITPNSENKSLTYIEWLAQNKGKTTWQSIIKSDIDNAISTSFSFGEFLMDMEHLGYDIKHGKYLAFRPYGKERFSRSYNLGTEYSEDEIRARIAGDDTPYIPPIKMPIYRKQVYTKVKNMPPLLKKYWRRMYSLNLVKKHKSPPKVSKYLKEDILQIEKYKEQFKFLKAHNLGTENEFFDYIKHLDDNLSKLYTNIRSFDSAHKKNKKLYNALADLERFEKPYKLYQQGYSMMEDEYNLYLKAQKILTDNGFATAEDIEALRNEKANVYDQRAEIKKDIQYYKNEKRICSNIQKSMDYIDSKNQAIEQPTKSKPKQKERIHDTHKRT